LAVDESKDNVKSDSENIAEIRALVCDLRSENQRLRAELQSAKKGENESPHISSDFRELKSLREDWLKLRQLFQEHNNRLSVPNSSPRPDAQTFSFTSSRPLDGMIRYLTHRCGWSAKMHEQRVLTVSA
jgi:hypothetical protein